MLPEIYVAKKYRYRWIMQNDVIYFLRMLLSVQDEWMGVSILNVNTKVANLIGHVLRMDVIDDIYQLYLILEA